MLPEPKIYPTKKEAMDAGWEYSRVTSRITSWDVTPAIPGRRDPTDSWTLTITR